MNEGSERVGHFLLGLAVLTWGMNFGIVKAPIGICLRFYEGLDRVGVTRSMVHMYFMSMWAVLFNYLVMGETIFLQQILGGVLILWGVRRVLRS